MLVAPTDAEPRNLYETEVARIRENFFRTGDGRLAVDRRAALVDLLVTRLHRQFLDGSEVCLIAIGGYGRHILFPYSDVDLLFLFAGAGAEKSHREAIAAISRSLWDLGLRLSPTTRTLAECTRVSPDNAEFSVSLLDARLLAGDAKLFFRFHDELIPQMIARDGLELVRSLVELTRRRQSKYGNTIFHLEPNVKDAPGGIRDYHLATWLAVLAELERSRRWVLPERLWPSVIAEPTSRAFEFLCAVRCLLHYHRGRDDNQLTYELQAEAAGAGIGCVPGEKARPEEWMRGYFRHARWLFRLATELLDEASAKRSSLYGLFEDWRSRLSNTDFQVLRGRVFPRQPTELKDLRTLLGLFEFVARHGFELSREAERAVQEALAQLGQLVPWSLGLWPQFRRMLGLPHSATALRAMHRLGVLGSLFPEFRVIDSLVIRDFYHRYTVDEHTFLTIETLHHLRGAEGDGQPRFREILEELEQPELLFFALLFHDIGKGLPVEDHIQGSLGALEGILERLGIAARDRETIRFLVGQHLLMSATLLRRDIFDPETVRSLAETVGTTERLKMLCLMTYADIRSVSPEALTPWKAEMLWQLYAEAANFLNRGLDDARFHAGGAERAQVEQIRAQLSGPAEPEELDAFLEGFPRRYLLTHSPEEIAGHCEMARRVEGGSAEVLLEPRGHSYDLTVVTRDRPFLFAQITGTLAAWGMNILKADAFANAAGMVLDTFRFTDQFRTLELNPSEVARFEQALRDVLAGRVSLKTLLSGRVGRARPQRAKVPVQTELRFDNPSASHCTLVELIARDRPGLLYGVSSVFAELGCNIEVALIDTEGQKAIDVFYLTYQGKQLDTSLQAALREALLKRL